MDRYYSQDALDVKHPFSLENSGYEGHIWSDGSGSLYDKDGLEVASFDFQTCEAYVRKPNTTGPLSRSENGIYIYARMEGETLSEIMDRELCRYRDAIETNYGSSRDVTPLEASSGSPLFVSEVGYNF